MSLKLLFSPCHNGPVLFSISDVGYNITKWL